VISDANFERALVYTWLAMKRPFSVASKERLHTPGRLSIVCALCVGFSVLEQGSVGDYC
jgi:hypothetical protein